MTGAEILNKSGITIDQMHSTWIVAGKTWQHKNALRQLGGSWNSAGKDWEYDSDPTAKIVAHLRDPESLADMVKEESVATTPGGPVADVSGDSVVVGLSAAIKEKAYHKKKEMDIWRVRLQGPRTDRETFVELKEAAKKHGGYYSSYKGNGAKPGFVFDEEAQAQAFLGDFQQIMSLGGRSSFSSPKNPGQVAGISVSAVEKAIAPTLLGWPADLDVRVLPSASDSKAPKQARDAVAEGMVIDGFFDGETIWLFADEIKSSRQAKILVVHEGIGHLAVEEVVTDNWSNPKAWSDLEKRIQQLIKAKNRRILEIQKEVHARWVNAGPKSKLSEKERKSLEAIEIIAVMAERRVSDPVLSRILQSIRRAFRRFLRKAGANLFFSDAEVDEIITLAGKRMNAQQPLVNTAKRGKAGLKAVFSAKETAKADLDAIGDWGNTLELRKKVREFADKNFIDSVVKIKSDDASVIIPRSGVKKTLGHRAKEGKKGDHLLSVTALPDIIKTGIHVSEKPDIKGRSEIKAVHTYRSSVYVGDRRYEVEFVVREAKDGKRFYSHMLKNKKELKGSLGDSNESIPAFNSSSQASGPSENIDEKPDSGKPRFSERAPRASEDLQRKFGLKPKKKGWRALVQQVRHAVISNATCRRSRLLMAYPQYQVV
ncbi:MAG: hypothetical protein JMN24_11600 [gamma proteobacterium endosymbiont of Lamellibrachia anaximandri]|nr:hypothetical protein [gamma proteobacterium endosymbiont of Lamellibrachia anaximandri]